MNRVRAQYCLVPNPFNPRQITRVSLAREDVDAIVFWTRNPLPLLPFLTELDDRGLRHCFLFTVLDNPRALDPCAPTGQAGIRAFAALAAKLSPRRLVWRYDPIVLTPTTDVDFHLRTFGRLARALRGCTRRVVVSLLECYRKNRSRLQAVAAQGLDILAPDEPALRELLAGLGALAGENDMEIFSCADTDDLSPFGIQPGRCIDAAWLSETTGCALVSGKDGSQRPHCGCAPSRDIGCYETCLFGCVYCYATTSFARARERHARHDPLGEALVAPGNR